MSDPSRFSTVKDVEKAEIVFNYPSKLNMVYVLGCSKIVSTLGPEYIFSDRNSDKNAQLGEKDSQAEVCATAKRSLFSDKEHQRPLSRDQFAVALTLACENIFLVAIFLETSFLL